MSIYLDHSATTPVDAAVLEAMLPFLRDQFGNAASIHAYGQRAAVAVDQARLAIAEQLGVQPTEVIFTSGATEANNLVLKGLAAGLALRGVHKPHFITSAVEHDSVLEPLEALARAGQIELTVVGVDERGVVRLEELRAAIRPDTALISIMYVNSEVGSLQPIAEIGALVAEINTERQAAWAKLPVGERGAKPLMLLFHSDATQAPNYFSCRCDELGVQLLSLSAHKLYGPKGVGLLAVKSGVPLTALLHGGHHERNLRSGTLNVPGIVGLSTALSLAQTQREQNSASVAAVRNYLVERVQAEISKVRLNTPLDQASPSHAHFSFLGAEGEAILMALDLDAGIAVSTGSACASNTLGASKVLLAMGIKVEDTHGAIRFTLGKHTTKADIDEVMKYLPAAVARFRAMAPDLQAFAGQHFEPHDHHHDA